MMKKPSAHGSAERQDCSASQRWHTWVIKWWKFKRNHAELAMRNHAKSCEIMRNPCNVYLACLNMLGQVWMICIDMMVCCFSDAFQTMHQHHEKKPKIDFGIWSLHIPPKAWEAKPNPAEPSSSRGRSTCDYCDNARSSVKGKSQQLYFWGGPGTYTSTNP